MGITGNGERHLICRWGMDKLIPFEKIKSRSWLYHIQNFGVILLTSEKFWLSTAAATLSRIAYIAMVNTTQGLSATVTTGYVEVLSV